MAFGKVLYNSVFKRGSTTAVFVLGSAFVFERAFNQVTDNYFAQKNAGKLYTDLPCSKE
eukprot:m.352130 g.352130  ORF g.352130 m.352130 type:complete len:59 (-) comp16446_c0_seq1:303-479(-)